MQRQRRSFTEEYKRQVVELVVSSGRSVTSVANKLGPRDSVLRRWVDKVQQEPTSAAWRPHAGGADVGGPSFGLRSGRPVATAAGATAVPASMPCCGRRALASAAAGSSD